MNQNCRWRPLAGEETAVNPASSKPRDYALDNIRFVLIFAVVFAHFLEVCTPFLGSRLLYQWIYSFHMPAFIFLFGYNVRYAPRRIICRWFVPYLVFQVLYIFFARRALQADLSFQFVSPYWLLWYMVACILYQLLLPLYDIKSKRGQVLAVVISFAIGMLAGFDNYVGYTLSLSRFLVFQPWFLLGFYCHKNHCLETLAARKKLSLCVLLAGGALVCAMVPLLDFLNMPNQVLFGSYSYETMGGPIWMRGMAYLLALCWMCFLFVGVKPFINRKIFAVTAVGQNTWPVFLLHGFVVKAFPVVFPQTLYAPWQVLLLTVAILLLLGNPLVRKLVDWCSFSWLERFWKDR